MKLDRLPQHFHSIDLHEALEQFLLHQRASRHSPRTLENHRYTLRKLTTWCESVGILTLDSITADNLRRFFTELQDTPTATGEVLKPNTLFTVFKNVRAFFNFHEAEENVTSNPMKRLKAPKLDKRLLPAFTSEEIRKLEAATSGKDAISIRNRALVYFLLDSGCRLQEAASMRVGSIDAKSGIVCVVKGKGGKDRTTRLGATALKALNKYLRLRGGSENDPLWIGVRGPMTRAGIAITLEKLGKKCGVHSHAHRYRRTTALTMLRNGCDIYSLQSLLGHADLQVLRRYLAQTEADITKAHERFSPLDHL